MMVEDAADIYPEASDNRLDGLLETVVSRIRKFAEAQIEKTRTLTEIGRALSAEKNIARLLEKIVDEARRLANADGGTLYTMNDGGTELHFAIVQNASLNVRMGGTGGEITWQSVPLNDADGNPNHSNVSAYSALSGEVINIPDVYHADGFNFEGTRQFDSNTGYRSKSMLVVPMRNHDDDIIGVLQLLNAMDPVSGEVIPFSVENRKMCESLASQAAVALTNNQLINDLQNLLHSFIRSIATAIDEKSPYTGGHVKRVAELTMTMADRINEAGDGPFASVYFNDEALEELKLAAWLHDVGKITTPEHVVDKSTKLEGVFDRIETVKVRFEVLKRDLEIQLLKNLARAQDETHRNKIKQEYQKQKAAIEEELAFISEINIGAEFVPDEAIERLKRIAARPWSLNGTARSLLEPDEVENLSVRRGTLNEKERGIINNHAAVTYKMLSQLPFPKKLKNVPAYAAAHHERLDGSGYPLGLTEKDLPLQARIMAIADVFEALTARDRPYKKGKNIAEALKILEFMVKDRHIDADLFHFFVEGKLYRSYALQELAPEQIDRQD